VVNYLLRLGWGHGDEEIISREQAVEWFDISDVNKGASRFDFAKLANLNGHYLREADDARLAALVAPRMAGTVDMALLAQAMPVLKVRAKDLNELASGAAFLFATRPLALEEKAAALLTGEARELLAQIHARLAAQAEWTTPALEASLKAQAGELGLGLGKLAQPLRAALTGQTTSPGILTCWFCSGKKKAWRGSPLRPKPKGPERICRRKAVGDTAKISVGGKEIEAPVLKGTVGPDVVDIRKLYSQTGVFTYDPGFTSASCESALTYIDGDEGVLLHRGYPIGQLAEDRATWKSAICC
jgi:hypothetical protein